MHLKHRYYRYLAIYVFLASKLYSFVNLFTYFTIDGFEAKKLNRDHKVLIMMQRFINQNAVSCMLFSWGQPSAKFLVITKNIYFLHYVKLAMRKDRKKKTWSESYVGLCCLLLSTTISDQSVE